jgi:triosephosphate isomerase
MLIVANWKMNCLKAQAERLLNQIKQNLAGKNEIVICPPFTLLDFTEKSLFGSNIKLGAQNCSDNENGAFTGEISVEMLADLNVEYVILGHSERRTYNNESNEVVKKKAETAIKHNIKPIICIGESLDERKAGKTKDVVLQQIKNSLPDSNNFVIAYEPIWAIGSGLTPSLDEIKEIHDFIAINKPNIKILYGGSVNENNCHEIAKVDNVSGFLVGGASLVADKFNIIAQVF